MAAIPKVKLNNGCEIPQVGLGTWKSDPGKVAEAVKVAIDVGYRHLDCALVYGNENEIGSAIEEKINNGSVKREDLWITSKVWNTFHTNHATKVCVNQILNNLRVSYLDLCLIHWPMGYVENQGLFPKDDHGNRAWANTDYTETWKALEELVDAGKIRSIGISNFNHKQIQRILDIARIKPAMLQVECHPYMNQSKLYNFCKEHGITMTAYSPLGSKDRPAAMKKENDPVLLEDPELKAIGDKYNKSIAQVILKWNVQRGNIVIPKSVNKHRLEQNIDLFDFQLDDSEMQKIDSFNRDFRYCDMPWDGNHMHYPFKEEF